MAKHEEDTNWESGELKLYGDNDGDLHRQQYVPIVQNLVKKKARGSFRPDLAAKLFGYFADSVAKKYVKDFKDSRPWYVAFTIEARRRAAREWVEQFESEFKDGEWDHLLPPAPKVRPARAPATPRRAAASRAAAPRRRRVSSR